eukprot:182160-Chlamydomonas_euryale.AAC.2
MATDFFDYIAESFAARFMLLCCLERHHDVTLRAANLEPAAFQAQHCAASRHRFARNKDSQKPNAAHRLDRDEKSPEPSPVRSANPSNRCCAIAVRSERPLESVPACRRACSADSPPARPAAAASPAEVASDRPPA